MKKTSYEISLKLMTDQQREQLFVDTVNLWNGYRNSAQYTMDLLAQAGSGRERWFLDQYRELYTATMRGVIESNPRHAYIKLNNISRWMRDDVEVDADYIAKALRGINTSLRNLIKRICQQRHYLARESSSHRKELREFFCIASLLGFDDNGY